MKQRVVFDSPTLARLRRVYENARMQDRETFLFEGREYLTDYAGYLIQYLGRKLEEGGSVVRNPPS